MSNCCHVSFVFSRNVDPVAAIKQQYQLLIQMGQTQDAAQLA